jgi:hypothetical protein
MKPLPVLLLVWLLSGLGAIGGSMLGNGLGRGGLYAGAMVGGAGFVILAVLLAAALDWLPRPARSTAIVGGVIGLCVAAPIAVANLHTPITPVAVTSLAGVGALIGAGWRGGMHRTDLPPRS